MRKYLYAQMLLDIMTVMKRPTPELKSTARAWSIHRAAIPDTLADDIGRHCNLNRKGPGEAAGK